MNQIMWLGKLIFPSLIFMLN